MAADGRQRGGDDGLVERAEKHRQHDAEHDGADFRMRERALLGLRFCGFRGHRGDARRALDAAKLAPWQWGRMRRCYARRMSNPLRAPGLCNENVRRTASRFCWLAAGLAGRAPIRCRRALSICAMSIPSIAQDMRYARPTISPAIRCPAMTRPNACCAARWRRRWHSVQADLARATSRPESLRLLPPDPRGARLCALGAAKRRRRDQAVLSDAGEAHAVCDGYIAAHSAHSTGTAVDLTLVPLPRAAAPPYDPRRATAPAPRPPTSARPTMRSTWAPASTASTPRAQLSPARPRPSKTTGASCCSRPCASAASTIISANGGTFSYGPRGPGYDFPIAPRGQYPLHSRGATLSERLPRSRAHVCAPLLLDHQRLGMRRASRPRMRSMPSRARRAPPAAPRSGALVNIDRSETAIVAFDGARPTLDVAPRRLIPLAAVSSAPLGQLPRPADDKILQPLVRHVLLARRDAAAHRDAGRVHGVRVAGDQRVPPVQIPPLGHQPIAAGRRQPGEPAHVARGQPHAVLHLGLAVGVVGAAAGLAVQQPAADVGEHGRGWCPRRSACSGSSGRSRRTGSPIRAGSSRPGSWCARTGLCRRRA